MENEEIMESEETKDDKETEDIKPLGTWYYNGNFYHDGYAVESIWGNFLHILSCEKIETKKVIDKSYKDELDLTQYGTEIRVINIQWKKRYSIDAVVKLWSVQYLISHLTDEDKEDLHNQLRDEAAENKRKSGEYSVKEEVFVEKALRCEGYSDSVRSNFRRKLIEILSNLLSCEKLEIKFSENKEMVRLTPCNRDFLFYLLCLWQNRDKCNVYYDIMSGNREAICQEIWDGLQCGLHMLNNSIADSLPMRKKSEEWIKQKTEQDKKLFEEEMEGVNLLPEAKDHIYEILECVDFLLDYKKELGVKKEDYIELKEELDRCSDRIYDIYSRIERAYFYKLQRGEADKLNIPEEERSSFEERYTLYKMVNSN